jgi:tRNA (uracil-5-)-methyltransferase
MLARSQYIVARSSNVLIGSSRYYSLFSAMSTQENPPSLQRENGTRKRQSQGGRPPKRQRTKKEKPVKEGSSQEVLLADITALLAEQKLTAIPKGPSAGALENKDVLDSLGESLPAPFTEIDVKVVDISSTGDGLALPSSSEQVYVVPFAVPGDTVRVKVIRHLVEEHHSIADFLHVIEPSPLRDDSRIRCKYFAKCSGCQFQMLDYPTQLRHKRAIVERAYKNFSQLSPDQIPTIGETIGSPLQYGYRTKLTPHFDGPPGYRSRTNKRIGIKKTFEETPDIGFMQKGQKKTLDIEDCPIGTDAVRMGMKCERLRVAADLERYQRGATLLLRESTERISNSDLGKEEEKHLDQQPNTIKTVFDTYSDFKICVTDNNATSTEYIDSFIFTNPAGSFFQNNNSILPTFTQYIRNHILPPTDSDVVEQPQIKHLIDAYCGSGLFTITLSSLFTSSTGIDISGASIEYARKNATLNNIPSSQASFIAADAPELFKSVTYPPDETVVVIDPPRKGCDESFLSQLLKFGPKRVVYVSCNVHTQARDVGVLVNGKDGLEYQLESLTGFDFFPQTSHVESVAVLSRVELTDTHEE